MTNGQMKSSRRLALAALLLCAAARWAGAIDYAGYESSRPIKPGSERTYPLTLASTRNPIFSMPLNEAPAWLAGLGQTKGVAQAWYSAAPRQDEGFNPYMMSPPTDKVLVIDVVTSDAAVTAKTFRPTQLFTEPDKYRLRVLYDLNNDHKFAPEEIQEGELKQEPQGPMLGMKVTFLSPELKLPNGKPLPVEVAFHIYNMNMSMGGYGGGPGNSLSRVMRPEILYKLPLQALIDNPGGDKMALQLANTGPIDKLQIMRYTLMAGVAESSRPVGRNTVTLEEPMRVGDRWMIIRKIDKSLASVTLAEPNGNFKAPSRAMVGDRLPDFARLDLIGRSIVTAADYKGKYIVLSFSSNNGNTQYQYNGYRLMGERMRKDGDGRYALIFVASYMNYEEFFAQTAGNTAMPFVLFVNRDFMSRGNEEKSNLTSIFWTSEGQPLTIVADPQGKIILRESRDLYDLLPQVLQILQAKK